MGNHVERHPEELAYAAIPEHEGAVILVGENKYKEELK